MSEKPKSCAVRYRSAHEAYLTLKREDPETQITERMIRTLMENNHVPTIRQGRKCLVSLDGLYLFLENPEGGER